MLSGSPSTFISPNRGHRIVSLPFAHGEKRRIAARIVDDRDIKSLEVMEQEA